ncbi:MAG: hypothetical protein ACO29Z_08280 [Crocinitomicaceae bacterium]
MKIPASKQEMQMVCDSVNELHESMKRSAEIAKKTINMLRDNFLSIDEEFRKKLEKENVKIDAAMWQMNVIMYQMQDHKERAVSEQEFEF